MGNVKFRLEIDNVDRFYRLLDKTKEEMLEDAGKFVEGKARILVPVDTGNLKGSLDNRMKNAYTVQIGTDVEYSTDVEFGTSKQSAQPYLLPAYEMNKEKIKERMRKRVAQLGRGK